MKDFKKNTSVLLKGFAMGIAEIVPGVSGSTLALVMKIYFDFISFLYQVSNFFKEIVLFLVFKSNRKKIFEVFKKIDFTFGIFLFLGMFLAIASFSNIMSSLLETHKEYVLAFFFGLVLGSVTVPWKAMKERGLVEVTLVVLTFLLFFTLLSPENTYSLQESPNSLYFFLAGSAAICAMVLPGISGSFVFLMLGVYEFIINYISNLTKLIVDWNEILNLAAVFLGIVLGFSIFVRILRNALEKHSSVIFAILTGIILSSLRVLWPYYEIDFPGEILFLSSTAFVGFGMVSFLKKLS